MNKSIKQFIYDETIKDTTPWRTNLLQDMAVSHLGIQGAPGTKFCINNENNSIEIGATGIYEIDLGDISGISYLKFLNLVDNTSEDFSIDNKIIVDVIYQEGGIK